MAKMTLAEIAGHYHRCTKTFLKYVEELDIPHVKLGRDWLFDLIEVETHLRARMDAKVKVDLSAKKVNKRERKTLPHTVRYETLLGLR